MYADSYFNMNGCVHITTNFKIITDQHLGIKTMVSKNIFESMCKAVRAHLDMWLVWLDEETDDTIISQEYSNSLDKISDIFMKSDKIRIKYSKMDINDLFRHICIYLDKNASDMSDEDISNYVNYILNKKRNIICFVPLYELEGFPEGYKVGNSKITLFENLPRELKENIDEHYIFEYKQRDDTEKTFTLEDYKNIHMSKHWICRRVEGVGHYKLNEEAYEKINDDLNILRIAYKSREETITLDHKDFFYFDSDMKLIGSSHKCRNSVQYLDFRDDEIKILNEVFLKDEKSDIDHRIATSLKLYGLQTTVTPVEIKFVLIMNALEGLLLSKTDTNYLGKRLSEKVAFLIGKEKDERLQTYLTMKEMYNKRSNFTHQKQRMNEKDKITESDLLYLSNAFIRTVTELLELERNSIIQTIEGDKNKKSLDSYIKDVMFS